MMYMIRQPGACHYMTTEHKEGMLAVLLGQGQHEVARDLLHILQKEGAPICNSDLGLTIYMSNG